MTKNVLHACDVKLSNDLHALTAAFTAFRELMNERDKRYAELDKSNKEAIRAAFDSAERAAEKTEIALKEYKTGANEWRDTVKDLIGNLRESRSQETGKDEGLEIAKATQRWVVGIGIPLVLFVLGLAVKMFLG